jgi:hypothetical protein
MSLRLEAFGADGGFDPNAECDDIGKAVFVEIGAHNAERNLILGTDRAALEAIVVMVVVHRRLAKQRRQCAPPEARAQWLSNVRPGRCLGSFGVMMA